MVSHSFEPLRSIISAAALLFLSTQVTGCLKMRTYLSGMPECKLGLNDKVWPAVLTCHGLAELECGMHQTYLAVRSAHVSRH
jgi:hypothetical protein